MAEYNPMSVAGIDDEEDLGLEIDLEEPEEVEENNNDNDAGSDTASTNDDKKDENSSETVGILMVVWVVIILGVIVLIAGNVIKSKSKDKEKEVNDVATPVIETVQEKIVVNNAMLDVNELLAGADMYSEVIEVKHSIQVIGDSVVMYLYGTSPNNGVVYIPVNTIDEFNAVKDGDSIEYIYSQLKISGELKIIVRSWKNAK